MTERARNRFWQAGYEADPESLEDFFEEGVEAEFFDSDSAFPEGMEHDEDWEAIFDAGFSPEDVAREAFAEIADADDAEVNDFLLEMTAEMTEAELESFWRGLARFGKKALRVAAPIVRTAAPIVGTAIGGPIGGAIGGLVGQGVGALSAHASRSRGRGRSRGAPRRVRVSRRRSGRRMRHARRMPARRRGGINFGQQAAALLGNRQVQSALMNIARRGVGSIIGRGGETISEAAAIAGVIHGLTEALSEAQQRGHDLDSFDGDFAPGDFADGAEAFAALVELIGIDEEAGERAGPCPETGEAICRCNT